MNTFDRLIEIVFFFLLFLLPHQDVQWNDLDNAYKRRVFTFDPWRFRDLPEMVEEFHMKGLKYILILVGHLEKAESKFF